MSLNSTPSSERVHIGFFGRRNAGKSSVVNAVTGQDLAVVSDTAGTTTDPVYKSMELLPLGPVVIMDTPGFDDVGSLGQLRVRKTRLVLNRADLAILVVDASAGLQECDRQLISIFREKEIPFLVALNKSDLIAMNDRKTEYPEGLDEEHCLYVSALKDVNIHELKERIGRMIPESDGKTRLIGDLLQPDDLAVLVIPIDKAAPKGRLILPEQQTIRDILDADAMTMVVKEDRLASALSKLGRTPACVVTDSQVFASVAKTVPETIPLTSFSILMARYKGFLENAVRGVRTVDRLCDGDKILISEGCTHHRQCNDIGTVKIPKWIRDYTGKEIVFHTTSGTEFPEDVSGYRLVLHCGACMLNDREVRYRMKSTLDQGVPFTNYGTLIAYIHGILPRALSLFPELQELLKEEK